MISLIKSASLIGIEAIDIIVEVDAKRGMPTEHIVGLPDTVIKESRLRIKSALKNTGFELPLKTYTINLAPADIPKEGAYFDLAISAGILTATQQLKLNTDAYFIGELSLSGGIKGIKGILSICDLVSKSKTTKLVLPKENVEEASLIPNVSLFPISHLKELSTLDYSKPYKKRVSIPVTKTAFSVDYKEVKGQYLGKQAMEIAAAGHHNLLLVGPPGSGKSMLCQRFQTILPPLSETEAIESLKIQSISKQAKTLSLARQRPFRTPHHTISYAGLVGGGRSPLPGEISLAHNGVLFLDELPEFSRQALEVLRQPLENGNVTISRANQSVTYPAQFLLIATMNPCPCGYANDPHSDCICSPHARQQYLKKISGPILDRFDIIIEIPRLKKTDFTSLPENSSSSEDISRRISQSLARQEKRQGSQVFNGKLSPRSMQQHIKLSKEQRGLLGDCVEKGLLTGRSFDKIVKVSRTIADLNDSDTIKDEHISQALQFRHIPWNQ